MISQKELAAYISAAKKLEKAGADEAVLAWLALEKAAKGMLDSLRKRFEAGEGQEPGKWRLVVSRSVTTDWKAFVARFRMLLLKHKDAGPELERIDAKDTASPYVGERLAKCEVVSTGE